VITQHVLREVVVNTVNQLICPITTMTLTKFNFKDLTLFDLVFEIYFRFTTNVRSDVPSRGYRPEVTFSTQWKPRHWSSARSLTSYLNLSTRCSFNSSTSYTQFWDVWSWS